MSNFDFELGWVFLRGRGVKYALFMISFTLQKEMHPECDTHAHKARHWLKHARDVFTEVNVSQRAGSHFVSYFINKRALQEGVELFWGNKATLFHLFISWRPFVKMAPRNGDGEQRWRHIIVARMKWAVCLVELVHSTAFRFSNKNFYFTSTLNCFVTVIFFFFFCLQNINFQVTE